MSLRIILTCFALAYFAFVGFYYGTRFLRMNNHMLGYEWYILATSASCAILYFLGIEPAGYVTDFLDKFSKLFGISVIASLGMLKAVNGFTLPVGKEIAIFVGALALTLVCYTVPPLAALLPYTTFAMSQLFTLLLCYLVIVSFRRGLPAYGWGVIAVLIFNLPVSIIQDFYVLPTEETSPVFNKFFIENIIWPITFSFIFYLYRAIEGTDKNLIGRTKSMNAIA